VRSSIVGAPRRILGASTVFGELFRRNAHPIL
jgi:hypothetical protein